MLKSTSIAVLGAIAAVQAATSSRDLRLMSYNIRYAAEELGEGEQPWTARRPRMATQLHYELQNRPDTLVCAQEALYQQVLDIRQDLGDAWEYTGVGRDDGETGGEMSPIFYNNASWSLESAETYWLSETPDVVGSVGWDAALPRIAHVAEFRHQETDQPFVYICTHFDHRGLEAQKNSAALVAEIAGNRSRAHDTTPVFVGGDFNVTPESEAYATLLASGLSNTNDLVPEGRSYGNQLFTYTGFGDDTSDDMMIDFIFAGNGADRLEFLWHVVLANKWDDGFYISDHRPVVVDLKVPRH